MSLEKLAVGMKLDCQYQEGVYLDLTNHWFIVTIVDINHNQIKIHYDCDEDDSDDKWIYKTSNRIAPLHTYTLPLITLNEPERTGAELSNFASKPICYALKNKEYILLIYFDKRHINRYDIEEDKWEKYTDFPSTDEYYSYSVEAALDANNYKIYFIHHIEEVFVEFDIINKEWTVHKKHDVKEEVFCSFLTDQRSVFIPSMNQIHIYQDNRFYRYNIKKGQNDTFEWKITAYEAYKHRDIQIEFVWMEWMKTLFAISWNNIIFGKIMDEDHCIFEWTEYDFKIPAKRDDDIIVIGAAFEYIIFVYCAEDEKVYCIDTLYKDIFVSHKTLPRVMGTSRSCVQTKENYIHFVNHNVGKHYRINLVDLIPFELHKWYVDKRYNPLVFGYIAKINKNIKLSNSIPVDIVNLILEFVPTFL